jgi:sulfite exporter TauE/SafE
MTGFPMTEIWLAFLTGVAGSFHCLGMCGGIIAAIAMTNRHVASLNGQLFQVFYNLGRIMTYAALGVAAGLIGSSLDLIAMKEVSLWFFAAANLFVMLIGVASLFGLPGGNLFSLEGSGGRFFATPLRWAITGNSSSLRAFPLGLFLGFLPCGLVYAPLIAAAACGSALKGGAIMAAMGFGTMPLLLFFGSVSTAISGRVRSSLFRMAGFFMALLGGAGLWRVLGKMGMAGPFPFW